MAKTSYRTLFLCAGIFFTGAISYADIYKWVDESGNIHYSDSKKNSGDVAIQPTKSALTKKHPKAQKNKNKVEVNPDRTDLYHGINIRKANPEFGADIPKELCYRLNKAPCMPDFNGYYDVVKNVDDIRGKLSANAWLALSKFYNEDNFVYEFNLCRSRWDKNIQCVETFGYVVISKNRVLFYTFFRDGYKSVE